MEDQGSKWRGSRLTDILFEKGIISKKDHDLAINSEKTNHHTAKSFIVEHHLATEEQIAECLGLKYGLPFMSDQNIKIRLKKVGQSLKSIPYALALRERFMPWDYDPARNILSVLVREPMDDNTVNLIRTRMHGVVIKSFIAGESTILKLIYNYSKEFFHGNDAEEIPPSGKAWIAWTVAGVILFCTLAAAGFFLLSEAVSPGSDGSATAKAESGPQSAEIEVTDNLESLVDPDADNLESLVDPDAEGVADVRFSGNLNPGDD